MSHSKVGICNLSLARLGADSIRDTNTDTKRASLCGQFFDSTRDYLLSRFDWPFARRFVKLQQLSIDPSLLPTGIFAYQLPSDCKTPRDIYPEGTREFWEIYGKVLQCKKSPEEGVFLYYTSNQVAPSDYSDPFANLLVLGLAARMCMPLTQDSTLNKDLQSEYRTEMFESWESDANIGSGYRAADETPENDTFVTPGLFYQGE